MTIEPIGAVRPVPASTGDSHPAPWESDTSQFERAWPESATAETVIAQRAPVEDAAAESGIDVAGLVAGLLRMSELPPSAAETEAIVASFTSARAAVRALYRVPEARYVDPGLAFQAAP
jgi:hypothetical protein